LKHILMNIMIMKDKLDLAIMLKRVLEDMEFMIIVMLKEIIIIMK
jgi:hypothetical protein